MFSPSRFARSQHLNPLQHPGKSHHHQHIQAGKRTDENNLPLGLSIITIKRRQNEGIYPRTN